MSFHVKYSFNVKPGYEAEFHLAWRDFASEIQERYRSTGSALFKTEGGQYVAFAFWASQELWEKFWITKELSIESLTRVKGCLDGPSEPERIFLIFSNWQNIDFPDDVGTQSRIGPIGSEG